MRESSQSQHHRHGGMSPWVETWNWSQGQSVVLESFLDGSWQCASLIQRNGDQVHLTVIDGLLQRALRSIGSSFSIRYHTVSVAHVHKCSVIIESVQSCHLGTHASVQQQHYKVVVDKEWTLLHFTVLELCFSFWWECHVFFCLEVLCFFIFGLSPWELICVFMSKRIFWVFFKLISASWNKIEWYFLKILIGFFPFSSCALFGRFFFFGILELHPSLIFWLGRPSFHRRKLRNC